MDTLSRLRSGKTVFCGWSALTDPIALESIAAAGFEAVALDMQHGGHHEASILAGLVPVAHAGCMPVVRIPVGRFDLASRALDFGAAAVIAPMVNSLADAQAFAAAMKYPPVGSRSWGPYRARLVSSGWTAQGYLANANTETLAFAMIETRQALDALDDILGVAGIDGVFVGPADFSIAWTNGKTVNPALEDMMEAIASIAARAAEFGKLAGIYIVDPSLAGRYASMGYRLLAIGNEARYIADGAAGLVSAMNQSIDG